MASRRARWPIAVLVSLFALTAVPAHGQQLADSAGTYRFEARAGTTIVLQGTFTVTADTLIVDAIPGPCHPVVGGGAGRPLSFKCAHVSVRFDRARPLTRSSATTTRVVVDKKQICQVEGRDSQGRTICVKYGYESTERDEPVTARIRVIKN